MTLLVLIILLLPLTGFALLSLFGKKMNPAVPAFLSCAGMGVALLASVRVAFLYFSGPRLNETLASVNWLPFNDTLSIDMGIGVNAISVMMLFVITLVSFLVHLYSTSYMKGEERYSTYFSYLQLFTFSMIGLVLSINIFQIYFFWELVGVSSFLLIGFYYTKQSAIAAAKKAFIVTRFADFGFLIGILILGYEANTFDFNGLISFFTNEMNLTDVAAHTFLGLSAVTWALGLVFVGAAGKSAMFPLHVWLPDAMEGPTPVSALIHAATMVVAGVFLVARLFPVYAIAAPEALTMIAYVGCFTAFFAAIIACTQTDVKKALAYSTISQIAYMMLALGVARWGQGVEEGYTASMFHLFTHAFFKAALFLCAGVIIHAFSTGDINKLRGLRHYLPVTHIVFLTAALSISGIPFFSGFYSKESILYSVYQYDHALYYVALFTSGLTAFYMFRLYFTIFSGKANEMELDDLHTHHHRESWQMALPLIILGIGSILPGYIPFGEFISANGQPVILETHIDFTILPVALSLAGIGLAAYLYARPSTKPAAIAHRAGLLYKWAIHKFYIDQIYLFFAHTIMDKGVAKASVWFDSNLILGTIYDLANGTAWVSRSIKRIQSGRVQTYGLFFLGGVLTIALILILL
ncbi:MAG: NADH-quinone oxidoreductase subunit L [Bacteroidales bacterium]